MSALKVGDVIYGYERWGRKGLFKYKIVDETRQSWLVCEQYDDGDLSVVQRKVNKKTLQENIGRYGHKQYHGDLDELNKGDWVMNWRYKISKKVDQCDDYDNLHKIAAILGMEVEG